MSKEFEIVGFDGLEKALANYRRVAFPIVKKALGRSLVLVQSIIGEYPPQPDRNRSGHFNTYVRGIGNFPRAAFNEATGKLKRRIKPALRAVIRYTSQQLSKKWRTNVSEEDGEVVGSLENAATYSGYVIGQKDKSLEVHQTDFHAETGWVSVDDGLDEAMGGIDAEFGQALEDIRSALIKA